MSVSRFKAYFSFLNWLTGVIQVPINMQNVNCSQHQCSKGLTLVLLGPIYRVLTGPLKPLTL